MDTENAGIVLKILMKIDPVVFLSVTVALKTVSWALDKVVLMPLLGYSLTEGGRQDRAVRKANPDKEGAQLVKVLFRGTFSIMTNHTLNNFFYVHQRNVSPDFVLQHDHITLHGVTDKRVFFCVTDPGVDVYQTKSNPFVWIIQFFTAKQLVIMDHDVFNKLGDRLGDPSDRDVTVVHMTARCGSTLVSQMVAKGVPNTRVMSEPWGFIHLNGLYNTGKITMDQYKHLLRSAIRLQCKPEHQLEIRRIFLKMSNFAGPQFPMLKEMFPQFKFVFMTRMPNKVLQSYMKLAQWAPRAWIATGMRKKFFDEHQSFPHDDLDWWERWRSVMANKFLPGLHIPSRTMAFGLSAGMSQYSRTKENYACALLYEDLRADPAAAIGDLYTALDIPLEFVPKSLEALKDDAQKGTFGAQGEKIAVTPFMAESFEKTLKECGSQLSMDMTLEDLRKIVY